MELPPELVRIIREFSKPLLRYPKIYKKVLEACDMNQWPQLMKELSFTGQPKRLIEVRCRIIMPNVFNLYEIVIVYELNRPGERRYDYVKLYHDSELNVLEPTVETTKPKKRFIQRIARMLGFR
jgi:hypothetical protein